MTYAGIGTLLCRFVGLLVIAFVIAGLIPGVIFGPSTQVSLIGGMALLPAVVLIIASQPLGRFLAAGLE